MLRVTTMLATSVDDFQVRDTLLFSASALRAASFGGVESYFSANDDGALAFPALSWHCPTIFADVESGLS